jgi:5-deoxy-glucuronate isomerase
MAKWYYPCGAAARDAWETVIDSRTPDWHYAGLRIGRLVAAEELTLPADETERIVLPLAGSFTVTTGSWSADLAGRESVFAGPTDLAYIGGNTACRITGVGRVAVASAPARSSRPPVHLRADQTPVEFRGSGDMSREVRNFGVPGVLDADSIIACEVLTPAGNWSSYPAHKHDHAQPGGETQLEEIYYFDMRVAPSEGPGSPGTATAGLEAASGNGQASGQAPRPTGQPFGYQQVTASDERPIDVLTEVHPGDIVLVPYGWHGPSVAAPGYDMYYLNVMAGPGKERAWRITDHPDQTWLRGVWPSQPVDPRLPFGR